MYSGNKMSLFITTQVYGISLRISEKITSKTKVKNLHQIVYKVVMKLTVIAGKMLDPKMLMRVHFAVPNLVYLMPYTCVNQSNIQINIQSPSNSE